MDWMKGNSLIIQVIEDSLVVMGANLMLAEGNIRAGMMEKKDQDLVDVSKTRDGIMEVMVDQPP